MFGSKSTEEIFNSIEEKDEYDLETNNIILDLVLKIVNKKSFSEEEQVKYDNFQKNNLGIINGVLKLENSSNEELSQSKINKINELYRTKTDDTILNLVLKIKNNPPLSVEEQKQYDYFQEKGLGIINGKLELLGYEKTTKIDDYIQAGNALETMISGTLNQTENMLKDEETKTNNENKWTEKIIEKLYKNTPTIIIESTRKVRESISNIYK